MLIITWEFCGVIRFIWGIDFKVLYSETAIFSVWEMYITTNLKTISASRKKNNISSPDCSFLHKHVFLFYNSINYAKLFWLLGAKHLGKIIIYDKVQQLLGWTQKITWCLGGRGCAIHFPHKGQRYSCQGLHVNSMALPATVDTNILNKYSRVERIPPNNILPVRLSQPGSIQ